MTRRYIYAILLFLALSLADWAISHSLITAGLGREANRLAAQVIARFGWTGFLIGKLSVCGILALWGLAPLALLPGDRYLRWGPLLFNLIAQSLTTAAAIHCALVV